jgi:WD40 repeat protein
LREARPRALKRSGLWHFAATDFHPTGDWVVANTHDMSEISFWPLSTRLPDVVDGSWYFLGFTPDGRYLTMHNMEADEDGTHHMRLKPVPGSGAPEIPDLRLPSVVNGMDVDANNEYVVTSWYGRDMLLIPTSGEEPRHLEEFVEDDLTITAFSPSGRLVAGADEYTTGKPTLRVWEIETGNTRVFDQPTDPEAASEKGYVNRLEFVDEDTLYTSGTAGLLRWDLETGNHERIRRSPPGGWLYMSMATEGRRILLSDFHETPEGQIAALLDLETGEIRDLRIPGHGFLQLSPDGTLWLSAETDGSLRVGHIEGGDPYLFLGHETATGFPPAISPDNRWVASSTMSSNLRLWPMPDLSKPPLYTLPHDELIAKLHSLTNIRVVRDEASPNGWKLEIGPFPGWAEVPEW